jgi:hypothetical protein
MLPLAIKPSSVKAPGSVNKGLNNQRVSTMLQPTTAVEFSAALLIKGLPDTRC